MTAWSHTLKVILAIIIKLKTLYKPDLTKNKEQNVKISQYLFGNLHPCKCSSLYS